MKRFVFILCFIAATFVSASVFTSCKKDPKPDENPKKALLVILDGWGIGDQGVADAIAQTPTPYMDYLNATYPHSILQASGVFLLTCKSAKNGRRYFYLFGL